MQSEQSWLLTIAILNTCPSGLLSWLLAIKFSLRKYAFQIYAILTFSIGILDLWIIHILDLSTKYFDIFLPITKGETILLGLVFGLIIFFVEVFSEKCIKLKRQGKSVMKIKPPFFFICSLLLSLVSIACFEEVIFRAFLFIYFSRYVKIAVNEIIIILSLFYGFNHVTYGLKNVILKIFEGVMYSMLLLYTSSIYSAMIAHVLFNVLVVVYSAF